jgi:hypothetical protein
MTGSDANDPRTKLTPGMYDAGEVSMGIKHLRLIKKPGPFQLGTTDPGDSKVQKTLGVLGVADTSKIPKHADGYGSTGVCKLGLCFPGKSPVSG